MENTACNDEQSQQIKTSLKITQITEFNYKNGIPKSLRMVTAATKLKDACSLEEKL